MKIKNKYFIFISLLTAIEFVIFLSFEKKIVSYSIVAFVIIAYSVFFLRFVFCWNKIFEYLKTSNDNLYKKHTINFMGIRMWDRYTLQDKEVINVLDKNSLQYVHEIRVLQFYFFISFLIFLTLSIIITSRK